MKREELMTYEADILLEGNGCDSVYLAGDADEVMDTMEKDYESNRKLWEAEIASLKKRVKELEDNATIRERDIQRIEKMNVELVAENNILKSRIKELEDNQPKWISVDEKTPATGDVVLVRFKKRGAGHYFPNDVVRWDSTYELQEKETTHWMPLPSAPRVSTSDTKSED